MRDQNKWDIAIGRFAVFVSNLHGSPSDDQISQYHNIIGLLQEACGHDLSQFKIVPARVRVRAAPHDKRATTESAYFRGQLKALIDYVKTNLVSHPC
jgi:hypothetical protein